MQYFKKHLVSARRRVMPRRQVTQQQEYLLRQRDVKQIETSFAVCRYLLQLEETAQFLAVFVFFINDGNFAGYHPLRQQLFYLQGDVRHFLPRAQVFLQPGRISTLTDQRVAGQQVFGKTGYLFHQPLLVPADQGPGDIENGLGRPVIVGQDDGEQVVFILIGKFQHVLYVRPLEPLDTLFIVPSAQSLLLAPSTVQHTTQPLLC